MKTIIQNTTNSFEINKSVFICKLIKINNSADVTTYLKDVHLEYKDATHYCFAYITEHERKSSDDGEPGGTAGVPIMEVLLKNDLTNILCVVIRYFGGIKLGAGGLVRAYTKAVTDTIKKAELVHLIDGYEIQIESNYNNQRKIEFIIKDCVVKKSYNEQVLYTVECDQNILSCLDKNSIDYTIINYIKIEKPVL